MIILKLSKKEVLEVCNDLQKASLEISGFMYPGTPARVLLDQLLASSEVGGESSAAIYERIALLDRKESRVNPNMPVWVPAMANGGLKQLIDELLARGWKIIPPES